MSSDYDPGISFEANVLSNLSELTTGQKYITKTVDEVKDHLAMLNGSVKDLYNKHNAVQLSLANRETENLKKLTALKDELTSKWGKARSVVTARWYHWVIVLTGGCLATIISAILLHFFF